MGDVDVGLWEEGGGEGGGGGAEEEVVVVVVEEESCTKVRSWEKSTMRLSPKVSSAPDFWSLEVEGRGETDAAKPRRSRSESASFACDIGARAHLSFL